MYNNTRVLRCNNCGAPLKDDLCAYCGYRTVLTRVASLSRFAKYRYHVSFGNEGFNIFSDLETEGFWWELIQKDWYMLGGRYALHIPMIKFITQYPAEEGEKQTLALRENNK